LPKAKPEAVEALREAGRMVRLGPAQYERALARLEEAHQIDANLWEAWYDQGWLEQKLRRFQKAAASYEKAVALYPAHAPTVLGLGECYVRSGKSGEAVRVYKAYLARPSASDTELVRVGLGHALRRAGKLDDAIDTLRQALRAAPRSILALNALGLVYAAKGQLELADLVLHKALDVDEKSKAAAETFNNLGLVALSRRKDQEAFAHFDQAARLDPTLTVARRNKASVYLDCGDYTRAQDELKQIVKNDPTDSDAWLALGVAERGRGSPEVADRDFEKALELNPQSADALFNLGISAMEHKKANAQARDRFQEFLRVAPDDHPKRQDAEARLKELSPAPTPATSPHGRDNGVAPTSSPHGGRENGIAPRNGVATKPKGGS
jgi:tetratricopeptide (TPR) repeat protein